MAALGTALTPVPPEPEPQPTPVPPEPETQPTPVPPEPETQPTPVPPEPDTQPPSLPLDLYAIDATDTSINLAWEGATDNVAVTSYEIYVGTTRILTTNGTRLTVGDLAPSTTYTFAVAASDAAGNASGPSDSIAITTNDQDPAAPPDDRPNPSRPWNVRVTSKTHATIDLAWEAPTDKPDVAQYNVMAGNQWLGSSSTPELSITGLTAATSYRILVYAVDAEGYESEPSRVLPVITNPPPSPRASAPPADATVTNDIARDTAFLYTGENPIQSGMQPGTIDPQRVAILRGHVTNRDGMPLAGIHISVLNHPEYGTTSSRNDGNFDLAINGGGIVTLNYTKADYLTAQRQVTAIWRDYTWLPEVTLMPFDSEVSTIALSDISPLQVAASSVVSDENGARQAVLMFPANTTATIELADGSEQPLNMLHVRATEYTVGAHGPAAMPGTLPANSGYTYAVEYSVDEAVALNARQVRFSKPVVAYVENFLHFPVGIAVPAGYYDREQAEWIAADSGRIIKILSVTNRRAELDLNGDGYTDDPQTLNIGGAELAELASRYAIGQELWRVPTPHFTPWDFNWPFSAPGDAVAPNGGDPSADKPEDDPCTRAGSIIECQNQTLGEAFSITGAPFQLRYTSAHARGHSATSSLSIPVSGLDVPDSLKRIELDISIAGRKYHEIFSATAALNYSFIWDRKDAYGRLAQGWHDIVAQIGFVYDGVYQRTSRFGYNGNGTPIDGNKARQEVTIQQSWHDQIGGFDVQSQGLGGWSLDIQHSYDAAGKVAYLGNGGQQSGQYVGPIISQAMYGEWPKGTTIAPDGKLYYVDQWEHSVWYLKPWSLNLNFPYERILVAGAGSRYASGGFSGDGGPAIFAKLNSPNDLVFGKDGSLYIADSGNNRVRRVDKDGKISTFAGNGIFSYYPLVDGSIAKDSWICDPYALAAAADGSIYIASNACSTIYRVSPDGRIATIAGTGWATLSGDGGPAANAALNHPSDIALGPDGSLYIADTQNQRIRRIGTDGIITTVAGSGPIGSNNGQSAGDGTLATNARLYEPVGLDVRPDGSIYVAEHWRVRWISPDGTIRTIVGGPNPWEEFVDQGQPAIKAKLSDIGGIVVAPDGVLYLSVDYEGPNLNQNARILQVRAAMPGFSTHEIALPSADGSQLYQFTAAGRHLRTLDTLTGVPLYTFAYDTAGHVISVTDRDGLVTTIERDAGGDASAIIAPYGQRTVLTIDAEHHLTAIRNPAGETSRFSYGSDGLLTHMSDPRGGTHVFTYDEAGRLIRDTNPVGGFTELNRVNQAHGYAVSLNNALGDTSSVGVNQLSTGGQQNISVAPSGASTQSYTKPDGSQVSIDARGNVTTIVESPDPRWGMQAPFVTSIKMQAADGRVFFTQTASREATLADRNNPLSLRTQTDIVTTNGRTTTTTYNADTHTLTTTDPAGLQTTRVLDARGRSIYEQTTNLAPKSYLYDTDGRLTSVTEGTGASARTTTLSYNAAGTIASSTDPLGATTTFSYDPVGRVTGQTLPTGHMLTFSYDAAGNRTSSTDAHGLRTSYEYDLQNRLTAITRDPDGRAVRTEYRYDQADNLLTQIDDAGAGRLNVTTHYTYTPVGSSSYAISSVTNALGQRTQLAYTLFGDLRSTTDPLGHTTVLTYTAQGRLAAVTTPGGHTTKTTYDGEGRPISVTDPRGSTTTSSYDTLGRLKTVTAGAASVDGQPALNQTVTYAYDLNGRVIRETDALGQASTRSYDAFGRPATISDPLGNTTSFSYDAMDRLIFQATGANGGAAAQQTAYDYDAAGRPLSIHIDPNGLNLTALYRYTRAGSDDTWSLQEVVDPQGHPTAYHYNSLGQRDQTIDALGQIWHLDFDNLGRLVRQTDPLGHATSFTVDALGRNASLTEDGRTQQWSYNADGTLASATDFAGRTTSFGYDADGRGIGIDYPAGTPDISYTHDAAGNVVSMTDGLGTTQYAYDALNRLRSRTRAGRSVGYSYDALGRTSQINYWGQGAVQYGYDAASRLTSLTPWGASATSYTYRSTGQLATQTRSNGVATTYDYDSAGRLIGMLHAAGATTIQQLQYTLDANGNRTQMRDNDGISAFSYDALNRLTNASYPAISGGPSAGNVPYAFDPAGNRTGEGATSYEYDAANRISSPGYSYDANGNLLNDGTTSYEYDAANRLIKTVKDGSTTTYGYDGNGNLIRETANGVTTDFVLDERGPLPTILGEIRSDGTELRYAYGPEGVTAQKTVTGASQAIAYPLLDSLGSVRQLTNASGAVTLSRSYDAFGAIRHANGAGWTTLGFTGERTNPFDGTIYLRARHYSPALGRFLQRDSFAGTAERPQSLNRYAYTENNPATWTDPSGRCIGFLFGSATCRPIWETGQGLNIEDGKKYWWSVAKSGVGLMVAPVDLAIGMITDPVKTLRGALLAPFQALHDLYRGLVCDDMELLARGLVGAGAMAIGAAEGLERSSASEVMNDPEPMLKFTKATVEEARRPKDIVVAGHGRFDGSFTALGEGEYATFYSKIGETISDDLGQNIEYAVHTNSWEMFAGGYVQNSGPGRVVPNVTLYPPYEPDIRVTKDSIVVTEPTTLRDLLNGFDEPVQIHWAACQKDPVTHAVERELDFYSGAVYEGYEAMKNWVRENRR